MEGIYQRALNGNILHFMGESDPYEEPLNPDLVVETDKETAEESTGKILKKLLELQYIVKQIEFRKVNNKIHCKGGIILIKNLKTSPLFT